MTHSGYLFIENFNIDWKKVK